MSVICIVDDQSEQIEIFKSVLSAQFPDAKFITADSGKKALQVIRKHLPDTILLDIHLPDMNGFEICTRLKRSKLTRHIPLIFMSGIYVDAESRIKALNTGAEALIAKPINTGELIAQVRTMLRMKKDEDLSRKEKEKLEILLQERTIALEKNKERFQTIIENTTDITFITNDSGVCIYTTPSAERISGYAFADIIGHSLGDFIVDEDRPDVLNIYQQALAQPEVTIEIPEFRISRRNGEPVYLEARITNFLDVPAVNGIVINCREITDRKRAEEIIRKAKRQWQDIFQAIGHPSVVLDPENRIIAANHAVEVATGKTSQELIGLPCYHVFHGRGYKRPPEGCPHGLLKINGESNTVEMEIEALNGTYLVSCTPITNSDGELEKVIHIATDITEQKRAEETLRKSLEEKEIMLKEIHHRVKNNLQIITSLLNLQSDKINDPVMIEAFQESRNRVISMALVHEKLYLSKDLSDIDFKSYVEMMVLKLFSAYHIAEGVSLKVDLKDNLKVGVDTAIPCGLILNEMVTNSLKYAFPENRRGVIKISMRQNKQGEAVLVYQDNGVGFPEHVDFYDSQSLGLVLIKVLTTQLGGDLTLVNKNGVKYTIAFKRSDKDQDRE